MVKRTVEKITTKVVRDLVPPEVGNFITYGDDLPGFGIRITAAGSRAFVCSYSHDGVEHRKTIGRYPQWSVSAARERFSELRREIDMGRDPLGEDRAKREAPRVSDLYERYSREHLPTKRERSAADDRSMWTKEILPRLKDVRVSDLTFDHIDNLHRQISNDRPTRANRVIEVLRKALNLAIKWRWISLNPAVGVHKNRETPRDRYISPHEFPFFIDALERCPRQSSREAITLLMLTGARKTEVLQARWEQFDLGTGNWTKRSHETKQERLHSVALSSVAVALLVMIRKRGDEGRYVFPGAVSGQPLQDIRRSWSNVCIDATLSIWRNHPSAAKLLSRFDGIEDSRLIKLVCETALLEHLDIPRPLTEVRVHDLRHTFASLVASGGQPFSILGALLGHTQVQSTARYAHFFDQSMRAATDAAAAAIPRYRKQDNVDNGS